MNDAELMAMKTIYDALEPLDEATRQRTMGWVASRLDIESAPASRNAIPDGAANGELQFADVAELVDTARPSDGNDYALVIAYWLQVIEGHEGWSGNEVNSQLKNLGHGLSNVTTTLGRLTKRKPSLVMQTAKAGRSAQARKTYKLTAAGIREVKAMVAGKSEGENQ